MRWPFMLRSTHDALIAGKDDALSVQEKWTDAWREAFRQQQDRHDAFVATIAERATPAPKVAPVVVPPRAPDAADGAAELAAAFDPRRRRALAQFVRARRAEGVAAETIAQEILHPASDGDGQWEMPE